MTWQTTVSAVDLVNRRVVFDDGSVRPYASLISTIPLDVLARICRGLPSAAQDAARKLVYSSVHIVGVGLRGAIPDALRDKNWIYFPDDSSPYHRVTVLSNYSPYNVPPETDSWSLMAEVCESPHRPIDDTTIVADVIDAMKRDHLIAASTAVVSRWHRREEHGYPTPFVGRNEVVSLLLRSLEEYDVYSRGRFGAWRYEVSNQDHSFMQGVEVANRVVGLGDEVTLQAPDEVNRQVTKLPG